MVRPADAAPQACRDLRRGTRTPPVPRRPPGRRRPCRADRRDGRVPRAAGADPRPAHATRGRRPRAVAGGHGGPVLPGTVAFGRGNPPGDGLSVSDGAVRTRRRTREAGVHGRRSAGLDRRSPRRRHKRRRDPRRERDGGRPLPGVVRRVRRRRHGRREAVGHPHGGVAALPGTSCHRDRGGPQWVGHAPPLHVPDLRPGARRGPADPRSAPARRAATAAAPAPRVRPHAPAVGRRGGPPRPVRGAGEPVRRTIRGDVAGTRPRSAP